MNSSTTTVVAIPRQRIWLMNNGIAVRHRAPAALNQRFTPHIHLMHTAWLAVRIARDTCAGQSVDADLHGQNLLPHPAGGSEEMRPDLTLFEWGDEYSLRASGQKPGQI